MSFYRQGPTRPSGYTIGVPGAVSYKWSLSGPKKVKGEIEE